MNFYLITKGNRIAQTTHTRENRGGKGEKKKKKRNLLKAHMHLMQLLIRAVIQYPLLLLLFVPYNFSPFSHFLLCIYVCVCNYLR